MPFDADIALTVLAEHHPHLRRYLAEYTGDGKAALAAYAREHPAEVAALKQDLDALRAVLGNGPADT